ncbi:protein TolR [Thalassovita gelatinovora]|uniref:Protein TolR n=1 Tax=Thalassovita gelatinovora TaxID=53501 RepID=A0A0P1FHE1_THAGE|nr:biopolymer transporter ExbD [Thalassovita gelatinovora]QIZ81943.1 biopolymer transporter ExbD [Thalassovita gelatinovora]CUH67337.1 protein TolR [Thalassovita gelatinovora]SEP76069.1 outer membrane transport energization protein ExbD [Thalassovita gelatinovora]
MQFKRPSRRRTTESVVPMINVVFLLLIFFMMSARIAPAPPFDLTLPTAVQNAALEEDRALYLSADGAVGFQGLLGAKAWAALGVLDKTQELTVRADADLPAPMLAAVLAKLAAMGISSASLALRAP